MRRSFVAVTVASFVACTATSATPSPDSAADASAAADASSVCTNIVNKNVSQAEIDGLTKAIALWKWTKEVRGSIETDLNECDGSLAHRFGPPTLTPFGSVPEYAACILGQGGVVPASAGSLNRPESCSTISCSPKKFGLRWKGETSGNVFELDAEGKPRGKSVFSVRLIGDDLLWSTAEGSEDGYRMVAQPGNPIALPCR